MTPKDRATELMQNFTDELFNDGHRINRPMVIKCALVAVNEILGTLNKEIRDLDVRGNVLLDLIQYYREVKKEIKNL